MKFSAYSILFAIAAAICLMSTSTNADNTDSAIASEETKYVRGRAGEANRNLSYLVNQQATEEINVNPVRREESVRRFLQTAGRHDAPARSPMGSEAPTTKKKRINGYTPAPVPSASVPVTSVTGGPSPVLVSSAPVTSSAPATDPPTTCWATNTACIQYVDCDKCCEGYGYKSDVFRTTCGVFPTATPQEIQEMCVDKIVPPGEDPNPDYTGPGYKIKNDTPYYVEISLWQVAPVYWELVAPGQYFFQETGAVWFTVKAAIKFDQLSDITVFDAIWPVAVIVASLLVAIVTAGAASGPVAASVAAGGASTSITASVTTSIAASLVGAGMQAGTALFVSATGIGLANGVLTLALENGVKMLVQEATQENMERELSESSMTLTEYGVYAGQPFTDRKPLIMRIHDGVILENHLTDENKCVSTMSSRPLKLEIPCLEDGTICGAGTTCTSCCNTARDDLGTKCGGDAWEDGTICGVGTTCEFCANGHEYWETLFFTACGSEPCWADGTFCLAGTTCTSCCNTARDDLGTTCGGDGWEDDTLCGVGTTCEFCANGYYWWFLLTYCGSGR